MSTRLNAHEQSEAPPDFREQLRTAMAQPRRYSDEDPLDNNEVAAPYRDKPDEYIINFFYLPARNQVSTDDASNYFALLCQAAEVLTGRSELVEEELTELRLMAEHEAEHGKVAAHFGNSQTVSHYGVDFVEDSAGNVSFWPYHFVAGPLKKIHHAWVAAAPDDRSSIDMAIVHGLGYKGDIEALRQRVYTEPPVDETVPTRSLYDALQAALRLGLQED